jgi:hypothetical protein
MSKVKRSFLLMRPCEAESYLQSLREKNTGEKEGIVLLVVVDDGDPDRIDGLSYTKFQSICVRVGDQLGFSAKRERRNGLIEFVSCQWFSEAKPLAAVMSGEMLLRQLTDTTSSPILVSVAKDEQSAFRLLDACGENQCVVGKELWESLRPEERTALGGLPWVHEPQVEQIVTWLEKSVAATSSSRRAVRGQPR